MLRNSAKQLRNFGRRSAPEMGPQKKGSSNCLAKTQVYAKPKGEVYGLTPARGGRNYNGPKVAKFLVG